MRYKQVNWENGYSNDGVAYINHRIQEMLSHFSEHIFSVPVCNTMLLLEEYLGASALVKIDNVNAANLNIIMDEFQDSFKSDIVIKKHFDEKLSTEILNRINSASINERVRLMSFLHNKLISYNNWCRDDLRDLVVQGKEKKKIEKVLRSYITGLIGGGYSRNYIFFYNEEVFNRFPVSSELSLDRFLSRFDFKQRKYTVYIAVDRALYRFKDVLETRLDATFHCDDEAKDLKRDKSFLIIKFQIKALDHSGAALTAYEKLKLFIDFYKFLNDKKAKWINDTAQIVDEDNTIAFIKVNDEDFSFSRKTERIDRGEYVELMVSTLVFAVPNTFPIVQRIVDLHNTSIERSNINNAFLNLWSILELLLIYEHNDSKINELKKKLMPILKQDYLLFVFNKLTEDISHNIPKEKLDEVFGMVDYQDSPDALPRIIILPKYKTVRDELINLLNDYPLIRGRIIQYNEMYSHKNKILSDIERYAKRVEWHIHRLYRTRNAIVHSGSNASNIKELSRHLHNYVDEAVMDILYLLLFDNTITGIDNAVIETQVRVESLLKRLKSKDAVTAEDIVALFIPSYIQRDFQHASSEHPDSIEDENN